MAHFVNVHVPYGMGGNMDYQAFAAFVAYVTCAFAYSRSYPDTFTFVNLSAAAMRRLSDKGDDQ